MVHTHLLCVCNIYKSEIVVVSGLGIRKVVSLVSWVIKKWLSNWLAKTFSNVKKHVCSAPTPVTNNDCSLICNNGFRWKISVLRENQFILHITDVLHIYLHQSVYDMNDGMIRDHS